MPYCLEAEHHLADWRRAPKGAYHAMQPTLRASAITPRLAKVMAVWGLACNVTADALRSDRRSAPTIVWKSCSTASV